jgi:DNA-binding response OmpR family regulator
MRILLIDDETDVTDRLVLYLENYGCTVERLHFVESQEHLNQILKDFQPEGVVLDYGMSPPGDQVYPWISSWSQRVKIVFYSNYSRSPNERRQMLKAGVAENRIVAKSEAGDDVEIILRILRS